MSGSAGSGAGGKAQPNPVSLYLGRLSELSAQRMEYALNKTARLLSQGQKTAFTFDWATLRYEDLVWLRGLLRETLKPSTVNSVLSAVRQVVREAERLGMLSGRDAALLREVEAVRGRTLPRGRHVDQAERKRLFGLLASRAAGGDVIAARDLAGWAVLFGAGLRRNELRCLRVYDYTRHDRMLRVLHAKGGKQREVYLPGWAAGLVDSWLARRGAEHGWLLCQVDKWGNMWPGKQLTGSAMRYSMLKWIRKAGLAGFTFHDARRTFIGERLDEGHDLVKVMRAAGHASPRQTAEYDRRPGRMLAGMADDVPNPFDE